MIEWYASIDSAQARFNEIRAAADALQEQVYSSGQLDGWCVICRQQTRFRLPLGTDGSWINLRECLVCECGMNARMRMIVSALDAAPPPPRFVMMERITPLYSKVQERYPYAEGCEFFGADVSPGSMHNIGQLEVRHENLLALSYPDRELQCIFHGDVLEHVPDIGQALRECHRVLAPGGVMLFTCPMTNMRRHIVRAKFTNGLIQHILPAAYHGNPMDDSGALVFTEPGLQLLDDIREVGFGVAEIGIAFDAKQGILRDGNPYEEYNMWPVIFRAMRY